MSRSAQARPPGTEFLDAETGRQKSSTNARTPTETKIQELSTRKSAQKRPIWRRVGNAWFAETGWWCAQSDTNRSPCYLANIRVIFEKNSERIYEKSQKCPQTCGFSLSRQIREQGETGSIDRRKQGNEFADSGSKKFRAAKCAAHGLGWFDSEADV